MKREANESQESQDKEREEFLNAVAAWAETLLNDSMWVTPFTTDETKKETP